MTQRSARPPRDAVYVRGRKALSPVPNSINQMTVEALADLGRLTEESFYAFLRGRKWVRPQTRELPTPRFLRQHFLWCLDERHLRLRDDEMAI